MSRRPRETLAEYELRVLREQAEQRDARMNQVMTRADVLEAIDAVLWCYSGNDCKPMPDPLTVLKQLREAFE